MATQTKQTGAPVRRTSKPTARKPRISAKNRALMALLNSPEWLIGTPDEAEEERDTVEMLKASRTLRANFRRVDIGEQAEDAD